MRKFVLFIAILFPILLQAQMKPIDKVLIVEGIVADIETLEILPSAILFNDALGITTTSDERGYFKIVVPYQLIKDKMDINIDIIKPGYKRNGWGISSIDLSDLEKASASTLPEIWNFDVQILLMERNESTYSSASMVAQPVKLNVHGYEVIKLTFDKALASTRRLRKLDALKKGNEKVSFLIDNWVYILADSIISVTQKPPIIFVNGKIKKLSALNKILKRSQILFKVTAGEELSKKYGKDVVVIKSKE
jgi:hypothetical protein